MKASTTKWPIDKYALLPRFAEPKIGRFRRGQYKTIEFVERLGAPESNGDDYYGSHAAVFHIRIDGDEFALKIFRFWSIGYVTNHLYRDQRALLKDEDIENQSDPFYAECRAYGRIAEPRSASKIGKGNTVGVKCYGFVSIPASREPELRTRFGIDDWDRSEEELQESDLSRLQPLRAIVKELVRDDAPLTKKTVGIMRRELKCLNERLGIIVGDVALQNYKGGHIVDFSNSYTLPHFKFNDEIFDRSEIEIIRKRDGREFDAMLEQEGVHGFLRYFRNESGIVSRLRPRKKIDYART